LEGAIVLASDGFLVYWEHWTDPALADGGQTSALAALVIPVLLADASPAKVPADLAQIYPGLEIEGGKCLNLRFERRRLLLS
jgi:predicted dienelactone hydrolase